MKSRRLRTRLVLIILTLLIQGLTFLLSISPVSNLPSQVRNLGLRLLVSRDSRAALITMEHRLVIRLTQSLAVSEPQLPNERYTDKKRHATSQLFMNYSDLPSMR